MIKVAFIDSVHPSLQQELEKSGFQCDMLYDLKNDEIISKLHEYDGAVIRSKFKTDKTIIDKAAKLKFIARAGAGMENIDVAYAESKGIKCLHAPEGNRDAVGEQAVGMLLMLFNNLLRADKEVRQGKWIREGNRGIELMGKTVGIIGYGNMGSSFAQRLKGFGVKVLAHDKYKKGFGDEFVKEASLEEIFSEADVLSLHIPLTDETRNMVNDAFINKFRKDIYIINTARGKVLNTADLVKNMRSGKVKGACLDVLEYEAVSFEHIDASQLPEPFQYLVSSDKVVLSPHIAGWTHESNEKIALALAHKIRELFSKG
jgi:D-3-phosphoglycerate dehydrogenase